MYNLYAMANHYGTPKAGHYTALCRHALTRRWYEFNDSRVRAKQPRAANSISAYVLFYELIGAK